MRITTNVNHAGAGTIILAHVLALCSLSSKVAAASPTVLNFDDLPAGYALTTDGYAGLTWEVGSAGVDGLLGRWVIPNSTTFEHPYSVPRNASNAAGSPSMGIGF